MSVPQNDDLEEAVANTSVHQSYNRSIDPQREHVIERIVKQRLRRVSKPKSYAY